MKMIPIFTGVLETVPQKVWKSDWGRELEIRGRVENIQITALLKISLKKFAVTYTSIEIGVKNFQRVKFIVIATAIFLKKLFLRSFCVNYCLQ